MQRPFISIVSPVYQAESLVDELIRRIVDTLSFVTQNFEIVLVEDGSKDNGWAKIQENCLKDDRIKGVRLSRNFGQHPALIAGINMARGEWVVIMDCDLQDRPEDVLRLLEKAKEGYDIVLAGRTNRQHAFLKKLTSKLFYKVLSWLSGAHYDARVANFGIYHRKVIHALLQMKEPIPYFTAMANWVGFKKEILPVEHAARPRGESAYDFKRLFKLAIDALLAHSDKPLRLIIALGAMISLGGCMLGCVVLWHWARGGIYVMGYTSLITAICFFSGLNILVLGIVGLYIGKIFEGIKHRPTYLIRESLNLLVSGQSTTETLPTNSEAILR